MIFLLNLLIIAICHRFTAADMTKRFVASQKFDDARNWKDAIKPCDGDDVQFESSRRPIFMDSKISLNSLTFSSKSKLIFGDNFYLKFSDERKKSCKRRQTKSPVFDSRDGGHWWDPNSWDCGRSSKSTCRAALPDIYRVPCVTDNVAFPDINESLYYVTFTNPIPTVKSLQIGSQSYSTSSFHTLSASGEGRIRIVRNLNSRASIYVESDKTCTNVTGCTCHEASIDQVCAFSRNNCPASSCSRPVKMAGFCCPVCGGEVIISDNGTLSIVAVSNRLKRLSSKSNNQKTDAYVTKLRPGFLHVYFVPKNGEADFTEFLNNFLEIFKKELNQNSRHRVVLNVAGGLQRKPKPQRSTATKNVLGIFFGGILLIVGCLIAAYFYKTKRMESIHYMFRRMSVSRVSVESFPQQSLPSVAFSRSFVNPSFGQSDIEGAFPTTGISILQKEASKPEKISSTSTKSQRENPLYEIAKDAISFSALKKSQEHGDDLKTEANEENDTKEASKSQENKNEQKNFENTENKTKLSEETKNEEKLHEKNEEAKISDLLTGSFSKDDEKTDKIKNTKSEKGITEKSENNETKPTEAEKIVNLIDVDEDRVHTEEFDADDALTDLAKKRIESDC